MELPFLVIICQIRIFEYMEKLQFNSLYIFMGKVVDSGKHIFFGFMRQAKDYMDDNRDRKGS